MRSHGGGTACYKYKTYPACDACREWNALMHRKTNARPEARDQHLLYRTTAKYVLATVRHNARKRQG